jgi:DNA-binding LacI/PurR family transcriptional regulator
MRKILRSMVVDGVVQLRGKTYLLQNTVTRSHRPRIVFITFRIQIVPRSAINQGQYQILSLFENECFRRELSPEIVEVDFYNPVETRKALAGPAINKPALGYVYDLLWYGGEVFRQSNLELLERLALLKRPVAILDEVGNLQLPAQFTENPLMQIFRIEGKKAGSRIARFLLDMGHREVAYVSSQHTHEYSHLRFDGVLEQFSNAGFGDRVRLVVSNGIDNSLAQLLDLSGFDDALIRKVIAVDRTESQAKDQYQALVEYRKNRTGYPYSPDEIRALREGVAGIKALARSDVDKKVFNRLCIASVVAAGARLSSMACTPLFKEALTLKNVTAWICSSDGIALSALEFLHSQKVAVPAKISVTGFDNEPVEAFKERLTTFDFNAAGFIPAMLNFLLRPPRFRHLARPAPLEIEGIIIQRETTAPPAK